MDDSTLSRFAVLMRATEQHAKLNYIIFLIEAALFLYLLIHQARHDNFATIVAGHF